MEGYLELFRENVRKIGIDVDYAAIERAAKDDPAGAYFQSTIENIDTSELGEIDLVCLIHCLEHVENPSLTLRKLLLASHADTLLFIETPILDLARNFLGDINGFFSVQHMTHFSRNSLRRLLSENGYQVVRWSEMEAYNGVRIIATPNKSQESIESSVENFHPNPIQDIATLDLYMREWNDSIQQVVSRLANAARETDELVFYGAGMHTELLFGHASELLRSISIRIVDTDSKKIGSYFRNICVEPATVLGELDFSDKKLVVSSYGSAEAMLKIALSLGVPVNKILCLYNVVMAY